MGFVLQIRNGTQKHTLHEKGLVVCYNYRFLPSHHHINAQWTLLWDYAIKSHSLPIDESSTWHCRWAAGRKPGDEDSNWHSLFHQNCGKMIRCNKKHSEQEFQQRRFRFNLELQALWSSTGELASDSQTSPFTQHCKQLQWHTSPLKSALLFSELMLLVLLVHFSQSKQQPTDKTKSHTTFFFLSKKHFHLGIFTKNGV